MGILTPTRLIYLRPALMVGLLILAADPGHAQSLAPVTTMFNLVKTALTGPLGKSVATIAVIGVGFACYMGRMNWAWFGSVLVGTVLVFSADDIIGGFASGD